MVPGADPPLPLQFGLQHDFGARWLPGVPISTQIDRRMMNALGGIPRQRIEQMQCIPLRPHRRVAHPREQMRARFETDQAVG